MSTHLERILQAIDSRRDEIIDFAAELMLQRKGIDYKRVDLMPIMSKGALRAMRFPGVTVPALKIDGRRIQGSTRIARELDRIRPEPPLYPGDPEQRTAVEAAERWGDEVLQEMARRILWNATKRDSSSIRTYLEGYNLGIPTGLAVKTSAPVSVTPTMCSNWAERERSRVTAVQPSGETCASPLRVSCGAGLE